MKKPLPFLLFCCMAITGLQAQTITWTGAEDENYSNPNNWDLARVPSAANDVIVPTGSIMTLNVAASVKSIKIKGVTIIMDQDLRSTNGPSFSVYTAVEFTLSFNIRNYILSEV